VTDPGLDLATWGPERQHPVCSAVVRVAGLTLVATGLLAGREHLFPDGVLTQEREAITIEALVHTGRLEEARAGLGTFAARYPGSGYLRRLQALVARSVAP